MPTLLLRKSVILQHIYLISDFISKEKITRERVMVAQNIYGTWQFCVCLEFFFFFLLRMYVYDGVSFMTAFLKLANCCLES